MSEYRIHWTNPNNNEKQVSEPFLMLIRSDMTVGVDANNVTVELATGQVGGKYNIAFEAKGFRIKHVRLRSTGDWKVYNVDPRQWKITHDSDTGNGFVHLELDVMTKKDFGSYFLVVDDTEGNEEKHMFLKLKLLPTSKIQVSYEVGALITTNVSYGCAECVLVNVLRNGESVFPSPQVQLLKPDSVIFSFPSFEDENAGTYKGLIKKKKTLYEKILAVIENVTIEMNTVTPPEEGQKFEQEIKYTCANTCTVEKVIANGIKLKISGDSELNLDEPETTPAPSTSMVYEVSPTSITIRAGEFSDEYSGMCQAVFRMEDGTTITKNILDIVDKLGLRMDGKARRSEATSGKRIVNATGEDLVTTHAAVAISITTGRVTTERTTELITRNSDTTEGATMKVPADNAKTEDTGKVTTDNITTESDSAPVATEPPTSTNEKITSTLAE